MSLFTTFDIAGSALAAQTKRINSVASNIANSDTAAAPGKEPYRAKRVVFSSVPLVGDAVSGVRVSDVVDDPSPLKQVYDPKSPLADEQGIVTMTNVDAVTEMVNMISASRSYQNSAEVMSTAKTLLLKTLQIGS